MHNEKGKIVMIRLTLSTLAALVFLFSASGTALAEETGPIVEAFSCTFNSGKDADDLDDAVKFWQAQVDKIGSKDLDSYFAVTVMPIRANFDGDFYWLGSNANLNAFARGQTAYDNSKEGRAADARFAAMSSCKSNTYFSTELHAAMVPEEDDDQTVLEMYGCTLNKGKTLSNVMGAEAAWKEQITAMEAKISAYRWTPFHANTPYDLVYVVVNDDLEALAAQQTKWLTSEGGRMSDMAFQSVMSCESGIFASKVVHMPKQE
jgi:hypothetical protein